MAENISKLTMEAMPEETKDKCFQNKYRLDQERVRYMMAAETFTGLSPSNGAYTWSPLLEKTGRTVTY